MQKRWTGKNVNLDLLSECVEGFFKDKGFLTKSTASAGERTILWAPQNTSKDIKGTMTVKIVGDSNDFVIEILARERTRRSIWLGMLTKSIGGGYLILRASRLREVLQKIETEFWAYIEEKIANLGKSTGHS